MKKLKRQFILKCFFLCLLIIFNTFAVETASDEVSIDTKKNTCEFIGNAVAKFGDDNVFKADKITILYEDKKNLKPKEIKALGNVTFTNQEFYIISKACVFDNKTIKFYDNVVIKNKKLGEISADEATYDIKTKKIDITSKKRVQLNVSDDIDKKVNILVNNDSRSKKHH